MTNKIAALIVTYNFSVEFDQLISSIFDQVESILIIDNFSTNECRHHLNTIDKKNGKIKVDFQEKNRGLAEAYNIGLNRLFNSGYTHALILDQDSILDEKYVDTILSHAKTNQRCIYCGNYSRSNTSLPTYYDYFHKWHFELRTNFTDGKMEVSHAVSSGSIISKDVFYEVGGFINEMFIDYVDIEFCLRAREIGIPTIIIENATFQHGLGYVKGKRFLTKTIHSAGYSTFRLFYICRNRVWCWKRFFYLHGFVFHDIRLLIGYFLRMLYVEDNRAAKLLTMLKGLWTGISKSFPIVSKNKALKF